MARRLILTLTVLALLAGCASIAGSPLNPFNWFGRGEEVETMADEGGPVADPRPLVDEVTELVVERAPGGAVIRARGLPPTQGYWAVALVNETRGKPVDGVLVYQFRALPPPTPEPAVNVRSRELVAGAFISDAVLAQVREIRVEAARNARSSRR